MSLDWGDAYYQRRAGSMLGEVRGMLLAEVPRPAPHTRFWFVALPNNIGFLQGDGPALRVWYRDSTLSAGFFSAWRPAVPGSEGPDRFFKLKNGPRLQELRTGPEDAASAQSANPDWYEDHLALAGTFIEGGDWSLASGEYEKLAAARARDAEPAYNVAVCRLAMGDSLGMKRWLDEAARRPVVSDRLRRTARASGLEIW
jgi:hypothetical protein